MRHAEAFSSRSRRKIALPFPPAAFRLRVAYWIGAVRARLATAAPVGRLCPRTTIVPVAVALALALASSGAHAVELYQDACCMLSPPPYVVVEPQPVVYVQPQPVVHVTSGPEVVVVETTHETVVVEDAKPRLEKPLLTWIEATGGAGMWIIPGLAEDVHLGYHLDAALSIRGFYMGLDFTWIHGLRWERKREEESIMQRGNLALVGMALGYRFNPDGRVHPELGAMFDTLVLDREKGSSLAFGIGATAGLVVEFPLKYGAIVTSLEVAGHRHLWSQNGFYPPRASVSVVGSLGYSFF